MSLCPPLADNCQRQCSKQTGWQGENFMCLKTYSLVSYENCKYVEPHRYIINVSA